MDNEAMLKLRTFREWLEEEIIRNTQVESEKKEFWEGALVQSKEILEVFDDTFGLGDKDNV